MSVDWLRNQGHAIVAVPADALDIGRRIQEGDELWRGDPSMELCFNPITKEYEVLAYDATGTPYVAVTSPTCDARILVQLTESDWQQGSQAMIERLVAQERKNASARETFAADMSGELAEKLAWGIRRAFATHLGGKKSTYSFN